MVVYRCTIIVLSPTGPVSGLIIFELFNRKFFWYFTMNKNIGFTAKTGTTFRVKVSNFTLKQYLVPGKGGIFELYTQN